MATPQRSFPDLLENIVANLQQIIRYEFRLAKTEIEENAIKATGPVVAFGVGRGLIVLDLFPFTVAGHATNLIQQILEPQPLLIEIEVDIPGRPAPAFERQQLGGAFDRLPAAVHLLPEQPKNYIGMVFHGVF